MRCCYLVESHTHPMLMIGMDLGEWGIRFTIGRRELDLQFAPFFLWWAW